MPYAKYRTSIETTLCAGDGDYTKWDTRLASQKAKNTKQQKPIIHCPSESESFGEVDSDKENKIGNQNY